MRAEDLPPDVTPVDEVDARCPVDHRLLLRVQRPEVIPGQNHVAIACRNCTRAARGTDLLGVLRVVHVFDVAGTCVRTDTERRT